MPRTWIQTHVQRSSEEDVLVRFLREDGELWGGGGQAGWRGGAGRVEGGAGRVEGAPIPRRRIQTHVQKSREVDVLVSLLHEKKEKTVGGGVGWGEGRGGGGWSDTKKAGTRSKVQGRGCADESLA